VAKPPACSFNLFSVGVGFIPLPRATELNPALLKKSLRMVLKQFRHSANGAHIFINFFALRVNLNCERSQVQPALASPLSEL
jgi:hypothetical protein